MIFDDSGPQLKHVSLSHVCARCRQLDDQFRCHYAAMWRSLIFGDVAGIKQHAVSMNAGDLPELFASMVTMQPWDRIARGQLHAVPKAGNANVVRIA
jgi:hypothetical protein